MIKRWVSDIFPIYTSSHNFHLNKKGIDLFTEKPKLLPFTFPMEVQVGQLLQVSCTVLSGDDPISLKWFKDNELLLPSSKFIINNVVARMSQLILQDIGPEHSGSYTCHAFNSIGEAAVSDVLNVKGMMFGVLKLCNHILFYCFFCYI